MTIRSASALLALSAALFAATPSPASAQVGVLVGFNSAKVDFEDDTDVPSDAVSRRTGFVGGVTLNVPIQDVFSVEVDALVGLKGAKFDFGGGDTGTIKLTYLDVPVMGRINLGGMDTGGHLLFGPSFNFKLNEKFEPADPGDTDDDIKAFETSFVAGAGVMISRFRIDARYGFGLTNIDKFAADGNAIKNQIFSILFGFEL